jgi:hypothetical protein
MQRSQEAMRPLADDLAACVDAARALSDAVLQHFEGTPVRAASLSRLESRLQEVQQFVESFVTPGIRSIAAPEAAPNGFAGDTNGLSALDRLQRAQASIAAATCERNAFLARVALAEEALEAGLYVVAVPLLESTVAETVKRDLATWEEASVISRLKSAVSRCDEQAGRSQHSLPSLGELANTLDNLNQHQAAAYDETSDDNS